MRYMRQDRHTYTGPINVAMRCAITLCSGHHYSLAPIRPPSLPPVTSPSASYANLPSPLPLQISLTGNLFDLLLAFLPHETCVTSHPARHPLLLRTPASPPSRLPHIAASAVGAVPPPRRPPRPSLRSLFSLATKASVPPVASRPTQSLRAPQKYFIYSRFFPSIQCIIHPL